METLLIILLILIIYDFIAGIVYAISRRFGDTKETSIFVASIWIILIPTLPIYLPFYLGKVIMEKLIKYYDR